MNRSDLCALLGERVLVCDGAMGTRLYDLGIGFDHSFDELNLSQPALVQRVHREYVEAGADLLETNSFGANRIRLAQWGLEEQATEIARRAAALARDVAAAAPRRVLVAGSVGPLGKPLAPIGRITREQAREAFKETITGLLEGGADLLLLETFVDLVEASVALSVAREISPEIGIIAQLTFTDEGKTVYGNKPEEVATALLQLGADVVGANCSVGPQGLVEVLDRMLRVPGVRLSMMPNAGMPSLVAGRYLYLSSPEYVARYMEEFAERGVRIVGGCCGTGPAHTAAMRERIGDRSPVLAPKLRPHVIEPDGVRVPEPPAGAEVVSTLAERLRAGRFCVSVELDPPRGVDASTLIKGAALCRANAVDCINIADSPLARARMSPLALATLIRQNVEIEIILHMSCRDRNLLGLQSELMGAWALGIRNILSVTGDPPQVGDYPDATGVFDVDAIGLVNLLRRLNEGVDLAGKKIDYGTNFFIGVAANPTAVDAARENERFRQKEEAGCQFAMTQPIYDPAALERWMALVSPRVPVLVGILPLRNGRHAEFIHNEVPGMYVPADIRERMHRAGADGPAEGVRIARELLRDCRDMVQGAYLMPPFNHFEMAIDVCQGL